MHKNAQIDVLCAQYFIPMSDQVKKTSKSATFWQSLPKPFFVLAPMANVTDSVFRSLFAKYGKPDVTWTEFVSADGLCSAGREKLLHDLKYSEKERPIVAQLFTGHPAVMREAAKLVAELGFDGLDINMGCPDRSVEKQGGGAAHMKDPEKSLEVLSAAREGWKAGHSREPKQGVSKNSNPRIDKSQLKDHNSKSTLEQVIPVSIKTRIGYNKVDLGWIELLLKQGLPALTVHLRTRKEMSDVPAHWELMPEIMKIRDQIQADIKPENRTLIIGNGDVDSLGDALAKANKYGCDGVMIGRGIFGKPWFFENLKKIRNAPVVPVKSNIIPTKAGIQSLAMNTDILSFNTDPKITEQRLKILLEHTKFFEKTYCGRKHLKNFAVMKKHFKAYVSGWDGAKELRAKLMETDSYREVKKVIDEYLS